MNSMNDGEMLRSDHKSNRLDRERLDIYSIDQKKPVRRDFFPDPSHLMCKTTEVHLYSYPTIRTLLSVKVWELLGKNRQFFLATQQLSEHLSSVFVPFHQKHTLIYPFSLSTFQNSLIFLLNLKDGNV